MNSDNKNNKQVNEAKNYTYIYIYFRNWIKNYILSTSVLALGKFKLNQLNCVQSVCVSCICEPNATNTIKTTLCRFLWSNWTISPIFISHIARPFCYLFPEIVSRHRWHICIHICEIFFYFNLNPRTYVSFGESIFDVSRCETHD